MIERNDVIAVGLTDAELRAWKAECLSAAVRVDMLLRVPVEYRQGVQGRAHRIAYTSRDGGNGWMESRPTEISLDDAMRQALVELAAQGVALLPGSAA